MAVSDPVVIGYEQNKFIKDATSRALGLYRPNYAGAGSFWSARETGGDGDSAYQVPVSKKFCLLQHNWTCIGAEGQIFIYDHDTPDTSGGTQVWQGSGILDVQCSTPYYREFSAGQYITMKSDATNLNWTLFGVEVDA